jgi:dihydropyrimidinase
MTAPVYDTVIRNGVLGDLHGHADGDIAIVNGRIAATGLDLPKGNTEIDAQGRHCPAWGCGHPLPYRTDCQAPA